MASAKELALDTSIFCLAPDFKYHIIASWLDSLFNSMKITSKSKRDKEHNFTVENALISRSEQGMGLPAISHVEIGQSV